MEQEKLQAPQIPIDLVEIIRKILKRGNTAEVKKERDQIVVVEIQRQVKIKTSIIG